MSGDVGPESWPTVQIPLVTPDVVEEHLRAFPQSRLIGSVYKLAHSPPTPTANLMQLINDVRYGALGDLEDETLNDI